MVFCESRMDELAPKAKQILAGARDAFMEGGFEGTSVDEIARRAGVSKPTIYKHFADKEAVFAAVVRAECANQSGRIFEAPFDEPDVRGALLDIARKFVDLILSPFPQAMLRLTIAESGRFPELSQIIYESGPGAGSRRLSHFLAGAVARGILDIDDVELAAHQFFELCKADLFYKIVFRVRDEVSDEEKDRVARAAVETFWKAYARQDADR